VDKDNQPFHKGGETMRTLEQLVKEFCVRKLARILYDCVSVQEGTKRELIDWYTAESFVEKNLETVRLIGSGFISGLLTEASLWTKDVNSNSLVLHLDLSFELFDRLCGRNVWDKLYQPIKMCLLTSVPYTRIHFD